MRISDWSSDVCSSDLGCLSVEFEDLHRVTTQDPPPTIFAGLIDDVLYERPAPSKRTFYVRIIERPQSTVDSNLINQRESQRIIDECCVAILVPIMGRRVMQLPIDDAIVGRGDHLHRSEERCVGKGCVQSC